MSDPGRRLRVLALEQQLRSLRSPHIDHGALQAAQTRADSVMSLHGQRSPPPALGETAWAYRRRVLGDLQRLSPTLRSANVAIVDDATLGLLEDRIYHDAERAAFRNETPGVLIPVETRDAVGRLITRYAGDVSEFMAPFVDHGQRVKINRGSV